MMPYTHFTLNERKYLQELLEEGYGVRKIARALDRSPSSVSREINRNKSKKGYHHWQANIQATVRRRNANPPSKLNDGTELGEFVREKLALFWSPECIAAVWNRLHPSEHVAFSTIYSWLKRRLLPGFSRKEHLRRRGKRIQTRNANYNTIHPDHLIEDWPPEIVNHLRIGDWEGDTVCGAVAVGCDSCQRRQRNEPSPLEGKVGFALQNPDEVESRRNRHVRSGKVRRRSFY